MEMDNRRQVIRDVPIVTPQTKTIPLHVEGIIKPVRPGVEVTCCQGWMIKDRIGHVERNLSVKFVKRLVAFLFFTAIPNALGWPMIVTSFFPRVTAV